MTATTCDTGSSLLRNVLADPASDTARLVYADWLDEQGEADRAEFIRVQCELTRVRAWSPGHNGGTSTSMRGVMPVWRERVGELRQRERELWAGQSGVRICQDGLRDRLEPRLVPLTDPTPPQCIYRRGFVDEIRLPLAAFLAHARDLFSRHPITAVVLSDRESWVNHDRTHWGWWLDNPAIHAPAPDSLPRPLADAMADDPTRYDYGIGVRYLPGGPAGGLLFRSADAAHAALSAACISFGRHLADLPPLE